MTTTQAAAGWLSAAGCPCKSHQVLLQQCVCVCWRALLVKLPHVHLLSCCCCPPALSLSNTLQHTHQAYQHLARHAALFLGGGTKGGAPPTGWPYTTQPSKTRRSPQSPPALSINPPDPMQLPSQQHRCVPQLGYHCSNRVMAYTSNFVLLQPQPSLAQGIQAVHKGIPAMLWRL